ncbi:MAG: polyvinylalcohol dehydrogenase [Verrucomicrobia bacterium]|nr:polyvinylalcohol dehydrogenase [Verrucomicrobiota bacterium]
MLNLTFSRHFLRMAAAPCVMALWAMAAPAVQTADWPQWRGADRKDHAYEGNLLKEWPKEGPKRLWLSREGGLGYAGFAVVRGKLFTSGLKDQTEHMLAFDAESGKALWSAPLGSRYPNKWGDGPRGTPTVAGDYVYALGGQGKLVCAKVSDGTVVWSKEMKELGGGVPGWGYCESVLVDGDQVICTPGGSQGALAALNAKTGEVLWRSKDFTDGAQYASIVPFEFGGKRQYVQLTMQNIVGVNAADGKVLWKSGFPGRVAVIPTPIYHDGHVYVAAGYGVGCKMIKLGNDLSVTDVYENKVMKNHHGGVIQIGDHLYGHSDGPGWVCQDFKSGAEVWASKALGKGAVSAADGMLYCVEEGSGTVVLAVASPKAWEEKGRFKLDPQTTQRSPDGRIWTHPVISNGKLYLRDQELIYCYDIRASR